MAIPPKQIGSSNEANLLWEISKQLDIINTKTCIGLCPTTTTTTTQTLFSGRVYWGESGPGACTETAPIDNVTGDNITFCDSRDFTSIEFSNKGNGTIVISYDGKLKTVNITEGSNIATFNGGCDPCGV